MFPAKNRDGTCPALLGFLASRLEIYMADGFTNAVAFPLELDCNRARAHD